MRLRDIFTTYAQTMAVIVAIWLLANVPGAIDRLRISHADMRQAIGRVVKMQPAGEVDCRIIEFSTPDGRTFRIKRYCQNPGPPSGQSVTLFYPWQTPEDAVPYGRWNWVDFDFVLIGGVLLSIGVVIRVVRDRVRRPASE